MDQIVNAQREFFHTDTIKEIGFWKWQPIKLFHLYYDIRETCKNIRLFSKLLSDK